MHEQDKYDYNIDEESITVHEPVLGYGVEVNAIKHATLDAFMACSDLDKVRKVSQFVLYVMNDTTAQSVNNDSNTIEKRIIALQSRYFYEQQGAIRPSDDMIAKALWFVQQSPDESVFEKVEIFPRQNGTLLLQWENEQSTIALNIGTREFSYAIVPKSGSNDVDGRESSITDSAAIAEFYKKLVA